MNRERAIEALRIGQKYAYNAMQDHLTKHCDNPPAGNEYETLREHVAQINQAIAALTAEQPQKVEDSSIANMVDALEKLSKLGNGDKPGNSEGNRIAQQALEQYRLAEQTPEPNRVVVMRDGLMSELEEIAGPSNFSPNGWMSITLKEVVSILKSLQLPAAPKDNHDE